MAATIFADTTALLEAIAASDQERMIAETIRLLSNDLVHPAAVAGRVGLSALWGGCEPHTLMAYATIGRIVTSMKAIPAAPEAQADKRRRLMAAIPLVQGFAAVRGAVRTGLPEPHPDLPDPILPDKVGNAAGTLGALREAVAAHDAKRVQQLLLGYSASGTDYRTLITVIYGALATRYPEAGHPLIFARAGMDVVAMAGWGGNQEPFIAWYAPLMIDATPDAPPAHEAQAFASAPEHDLEWLRKRLSIPRDEVAGPQFQREILAGDGGAACAATFAALRAGATPRGVLAGMELAVASQIAAVPLGDKATLQRAAHVLLFVHAISKLMIEVQDATVWPTMFTAAAVANTLAGQVAPAAGTRAGAGALTTVGGGLIAPAMLRTFEQQLASTDVAGAQATARRFLQLGHPLPGLAGTLALATTSRDLTGPDTDAAQHALAASAAALDAYLNLPAVLASGGQNALLDAAIRLVVEVQGSHTLADHVREAIAQATE